MSEVYPNPGWHNRLTVLSRERRDGRTYCRCICECGNECEVESGNLRSGHTKSCGCLQLEVVRATNATHGHTRGGKYSRAYTAWLGMRNRCYNRKSTDYPDYGGRGISVCDRWRESFENFFADMGQPPPWTSIDRIDNARGYEPGNCRWATATEQGRNKRNNVRLAFRGRTQTMTEWAAELGIPMKRIHARLKRGWSAERALTTVPTRSRRGVR